jgi:hypothetical protein
MTQDNSTLAGEQLLDRITKHVFLVMLSISYPKLSYQIADAVVEIKGADDEKTEIEAEFRTNPQWNLLPSAWRKKFSNVEGRARAVLANASIPFATRGITVLPVTKAGEVFSQLRELRDELQQYRDEFSDDYEQVLAALKVNLGDELYAKAARKLPTKAAIRNKFGMLWAIMPAGGSGSNISDEKLDTIVTALDAACGRLLDRDIPLPRAVHNAHIAINELRQEGAVQTITDDDAAELIGEARQQMNQFTQKMLNDMAREPRIVLADATANLLQALNDPDRIIRTGTIDQVRRAFEMVQGFEFLADEELLDRMRECSRNLDNVTPQQLNGDAEIGAQLAAGLQSVRNQAVDTTATANAVRNFRRVRFRGEAQTEE